MQRMTREQVIDQLPGHVAQVGSITQAARMFDVSRPMLSLILTNARGISAPVLKALNLRRVVRYELISPRSR
jgi:hypothetical protein